MEKSKTRIVIGRIIYLFLAIVFASCVIVQLFLAGAATFVSPINWLRHASFVHLFGFNLPIFMFVFAFIGGFPRWAYWQVFGQLGLIFVMYFTANMTGHLPWIAAAHPVIAMLLFILSYVMVIRTWKLIKNENRKGEK